MTAAEDKKLIEEIQLLKKQEKAVVMAHFYQRPEVQEIADIVGDSLELARKAAQTDAKIIVLCGVHFMAESAALLSPDKKVLLPDAGAGCPMADMVTAQALREEKKRLPEALVVAYVNTSADVKAESHICCTSANAVKVIKSLPDNRPILFLPDKNLGTYVMQQTGRNMKLWNGWCNIHEWVIAEDVQKAKASHPQALVMAHPECQSEVTALADWVSSTAGMIRFAAENPAKEFIVVTERGILHQLHKHCPEKTFYLATEKLTCANMKKTTLKSIRDALVKQDTVVTVEDRIRNKAKASLERMLQLT